MLRAFLADIFFLAILSLSLSLSIRRLQRDTWSLDWTPLPVCFYTWITIRVILSRDQQLQDAMK